MISAESHNIRNRKFNVSSCAKIPCPSGLRLSQLASTPDKIAFPFPSSKQLRIHSTDVIWSSDATESPEVDTVLDSAPVGKVSALRFGNRSAPRILVAASARGLTVWTLSATTDDKAPLRSRQFWTPKLLEKDFGCAEYIAISQDDQWVACCVDLLIHVVDIRTSKTLCLEGHASRVIGAEFCIAEDVKHHLLSTSEDRTFKVWDIASRTCLYQSPIISPYSFTTLALDPHRSRFCLGSEDGKVRFYDTNARQTSLSCEPRCLTTVDAHSLWLRERAGRMTERDPEGGVEYISSLPVWKSKFRHLEEDETDTTDGDVAHSAAILGLYYSTLGSVNSASDEAGLRLFVGMGKGLVIMDPVAFNVLLHINFENVTIHSRLDEDPVDGDEVQSALTAGMYGFTTPRNVGSGVLVLVGNALTSEIVTLAISESVQQQSKVETVDAHSNLGELIRNSVAAHAGGVWAKQLIDGCLQDLATLGILDLDDVTADGVERLPVTIPSYVRNALRDHVNGGKEDAVMLASIELGFQAPDNLDCIEGSPLRTFVKKKPPAKKTSKPTPTTRKPSIPKKGVIINQPVTFQTKVKSSGYTKPPIATKLFESPSSGKSSTTKRPTPQRNTPSYPADCDPIIHPYQPPTPIQHAAPITCVKYHSSGKLLATASADRSARSYRMPLSPKHPPKDFMGHNGMVSCVRWSHGDQYLPHHPVLMLTTSTDGYARMWTPERSEPLVQFGVPASSGGMVTTRTGAGDVKNAQFFWKNRLVLMSGGNRLLCFNYQIEKPEPGSVKPQLNRNRKTLISTFEAGSQHITSLACTNAYESHLAVYATSDKRVGVWDAAHGRDVWSVKEAQGRAVHCVAVADYKDPPQAFHWVFATSAVMDSIRCWDLRVGDRAVLQLNGHVNRHASVGCALSPCGRYVVTGSEDNHAYLYDIRKSLVVERLPGNHKDVVSTVDFNPVFPEIATGSYDGSGRLFRA
ncbi:WD repeat-containing protein 27 [Rhizophlyctis rosea]|nr:WD repeat-containing protein 27 [Rhizophlyctis rosea]